MHDVKKEKRWVFGRLFAGDVAAKGLCLEELYGLLDTQKSSASTIEFVQFFKLLYANLT